LGAANYVPQRIENSAVLLQFCCCVYGFALAVWRKSMLLP